MLSPYRISAQFIKFSIIGVANTIIGYGIYYFLLFLNVHYIAAAAISFIFGVTNSFIWNKSWVFTSNHHFSRELPKFLTVYLAALAINLVFLPVFVEFLKIDPKIAQLFFLLFLPIVTFVGLKFWSFR